MKIKKSQAGAAAWVGAGCWRVVGSSRPGFPSPRVHLDKANWMRQNNTLCKWFFWSYASSPHLKGTVMVVLWGSHQTKIIAPPWGTPGRTGSAFLSASCCLHSQHTVFTSFIYCELRGSGAAQEQYACYLNQFIPTEILLVTRPPVEGHTAAWCSCRAFLFSIVAMLPRAFLGFA